MRKISPTETQRWTVLNGLFAAKQAYERDLTQRAYQGNERILAGVRQQVDDVQKMYDLIEQAEAVVIEREGPE